MTSIGYTEIGKYVDTHGNEYENAQLCIDISEYLLETRKGNFQIQLEGMKTTAAAD